MSVVRAILSAAALLVCQAGSGAAESEYDRLRLFATWRGYEIVANWSFPITYELWVTRPSAAGDIANDFNNNSREIDPSRPSAAAREVPYFAGMAILYADGAIEMRPAPNDPVIAEHLSALQVESPSRSDFEVNWQRFRWQPLPNGANRKGHTLFPLQLSFYFLSHKLVPYVNGESGWDINKRLGFEFLPDKLRDASPIVVRFE